MSVDPQTVYVETWADHALTAFLARCTPSRVLRDRAAMFSPAERKRQAFLREKAAVEREVLRAREVAVALELARLMRNEVEK